MPIRGVRGATTVTADQPDLILQATRELLQGILKENEGMEPEDVASAFFTVTDDITSAFPALGARQMGWELVPMMCAREIPVPGSLPGVIRVLIHWNTELPQKEIHHVYLREAVVLRPDIAQRFNSRWRTMLNAEAVERHWNVQSSELCFQPPSSC